jgi:hypothetical protein
MKNLENYYAKKLETFGEKLSFEEKMVFYQKSIEDKVKLEYQEKVISISLKINLI